MAFLLSLGNMWQPGVALIRAVGSTHFTYLIHAAERLQGIFKLAHFDEGPSKLPDDRRFQSPVLETSELPTKRFGR